MAIEVEDDVQFCSLELNGNFVKNWDLVYEHQDGNDRLYKLSNEHLNQHSVVVVSFSTSDSVDDCWKSDSLYVDVLLMASIDFGGLHHLHLNEYMCYPKTDVLTESFKYIHNLSEQIKENHNAK
ncbi:hypothetical protein [Vibrio anguillarum]|uniref:Uncharacterized protein n=2 Tax=Vibrio anguillarum TaxID=55601 RepID=A0ABR9Z7F7_VIBAN|nr:hypothetical protein [Vibrio anguillarum]MBF4374387.1 hypothetical protein [Vibrio anguillarum]